jgi:hypothetical protein
MKDWKAIARAHGMNLEGRDLERVAGPLERLEEVFRPLVQDLPPDLEPATTFSAEEEGE